MNSEALAAVAGRGRPGDPAGRPRRRRRAAPARSPGSRARCGWPRSSCTRRSTGRGTLISGHPVEVVPAIVDRRRRPGRRRGGRAPLAVGVCDRVRAGRARADPGPLRLAGRQAPAAALRACSRRARCARSTTSSARPSPRRPPRGPAAPLAAIVAFSARVAALDGRPAPGRGDDALLLPAVRLHVDADRPARLEPERAAGRLPGPVRPGPPVRGGRALAGGDPARVLEPERRGRATPTGRSSASTPSSGTRACTGASWRSRSSCAPASPSTVG